MKTGIIEVIQSEGRPDRQRKPKTKETTTKNLARLVLIRKREKVDCLAKRRLIAILMAGKKSSD